MNTNTIINYPSQEELNQLKAEIDREERRREFERLHQQLAEIKGADTARTFAEDGAIHSPDTHQILKTKRTALSFVEAIVSRLKEMSSPRPVIGSISAIVIGFVILAILHNRAQAFGLGAYQHYIGLGTMVMAGYQIIKSGSRSLFLPVIATVAGLVISSALPHNATLFSYDSTIYHYLMLAGLIGLANSMFHIE